MAEYLDPNLEMIINSEKIKSLIGDFDPTQQPPRIIPLVDGIDRPKWSVMIPTFNCAKYLRQTLESVLSQDPGPEHMQIEVIDDGSDQDDPEAVVNELGKGRVVFFRKSNNEGAVSNFNTCIDRSRGELVHILHGDDYVLPGFYQHMEQLAEQQPEAALYACRYIVTNEEDHWERLSPVVSSSNEIIRDPKFLFYTTPIHFAGNVLRRSFYETHGGFLHDLIHTADWNMWERAVSADGGVFSTKVLACYRMFEANDTSRLMKSGENIVDMFRAMLIFKHRIPDYPFNDVMRSLINTAMVQERRFRKSGDSVAASKNARVWKTICSKTLRLEIFTRKTRRFLARRLLGVR